MSNAWQKIRSDPEEMANLARMMLASVRAKGVDFGDRRSVEVAARFLQQLDTFDSRRFDELMREFHVDLMVLKGTVNQALAHFEFKLTPAHEQAISDFIPSEPDSAKWAEELLALVSKLIQVSKEVVVLFAQEYSGDKAGAQKTFAKIKQDADKTLELLTIKTNNGILKIPDRYASSTDSVLKVVSHHVSEHSFISIENVRTTLSAYFADLDNDKDRLLQSASTYVEISGSLRKEFESGYLPLTVSLDEMIGFLSGKLRIRKDILALFYYESTQDEPNLKNTFSNILSRDWTKELAGLLLDLGSIESSQDIEHDREVDDLASIIRSPQNFRLFSIQSMYQSFRNLLTWSKNLCAFCSEHELAPPRFDADFPWLLKPLNGKTDMRSYEQLRNVCRNIIAQSNFQDRTQNVIDASVLTTLVLFFKSQEDSRLYEACRDAATSDLTSKMLYHFIGRHEEAQLKREKVALRKVIQEALTSTAIAYPWIEDVRSALASTLFQTTRGSRHPSCAMLASRSSYSSVVQGGISLRNSSSIFRVGSQLFSTPFLALATSDSVDIMPLRA